jgi:hypothetical protein
MSICRFLLLQVHFKVGRVGINLRKRSIFFIAGINTAEAGDVSAIQVYRLEAEGCHENPRLAANSMLIWQGYEENIWVEESYPSFNSV